MNTQNNASMMKTEVETFIIEEVAPLIYDNEQLEKWNELVEELGLQGQTKIQKKEKSPIPFLSMNRGMIAMFETLCPSSIPVEEFSITPIPVEILSLIALSKREGYFNEIKIRWDDKSPDPVVIGITGDWMETTYYQDSNKSLADKKFKSKNESIEAGAKRPWFMERQQYLIGKWSDMKRSFDELKEMAVTRFMKEEATAINKRIKEAQRELADLKQSAFDKFGDNNSANEFKSEEFLF